MKRLDPTADAVLLHWLDAGAAYDPEYNDRLSSHLPMALLALRRLGAPPERIDVFARRYATRLRPAPPPAVWPAGEAWAADLGRHAAWPAYRELFSTWLRQEGAGDVLEAVLPRLMDGCAGGAFHGLIRTAYAVQAAHRQELADALAAWACCWQPLPAVPGVVADEAEPAAWLRALPLPAAPVAGGLIVDRVLQVAATPGFMAAASRLRVGEHTLEQLARGSAELYAASGNFTVLHLLTSTHALRVLLPVMDQPLPTVVAYGRAFAAAWAASGARDRGAPPLRPWQHIVAFALASDDEHVVKLVDSCREQQRAYGGEVWRRAASRVLAGG